MVRSAFIVHQFRAPEPTPIAAPIKKPNGTDSMSHIAMIAVISIMISYFVAATGYTMSRIWPFASTPFSA